MNTHTGMIDAAQIVYREAKPADLDQLLALENVSFDSDRLSRRRLKHWMQSDHGVFLVAAQDTKIWGYGLVIMRKGTRLARLYSIAVDQGARGAGVGKGLLIQLELKTVEQGKLFMRLEVACNNTSAIGLYESMGYRTFGIYSKYYNNSIDAVRMQKPIRQRISQQQCAPYPWYMQTTEFTCGPSALMMAMANLDDKIAMTQALELDIWRQATTIFMTSGHGGCHPLGLALAAHALGFPVEVYVNSQGPLFIDGVRSEHKKDIMRAVDTRFVEQANQASIPIHHSEPTLAELQSALSKGSAVISLISTYQLDGKKIPHWVTITHIDDDCLYLHDSDPDDDDSQTMDYQHIPIARDDFYSMSGFGKSKLRTAVVIHNRIS